MANATTSSSQDDKAPSTLAEKTAAAEYKKQLEAEIDAEGGDDAKHSEKEEPAENPDSQNETEQEQESPEEVNEQTEQEPESDPEDPKDKRYREQLQGERKANAELMAKLQSLETQVTQLTTQPQQQKEISEEEQQILAEKQYLIDKYGVVTKEQYDVLEAKLQALLDSKLKPVQKKREDSILQNLYKKFPDVSPDKDPTNDKWQKVTKMLTRFVPSNPQDPLDDYEERFDWAYEKAFGKKVNAAQARQTSYTGVGGGSSAAKSRTTQSEDKYAHLSPEARAYKQRLEASLEEDFKRDGR